MRRLLRYLSAGMLVYGILLTPLAGQAADHATVFVYHRFGDSRYPSTNTTLAEFRAHLELLRAGGYRVLPLGEIAQHLRDGTPLPERCVALTVDDAFRSFLSGAMPLLREYGFPATLFVNSGEVGGADFLDREELRALAEEGVEIGNHSASHGYLLDRRSGEDHAAWRRRVSTEIRQAQEALTAVTGRPPRLFAYPYGEFSGELVEVVREFGFLAAFGQQSGVMAHGQNPLALPRFPAGGSYGALKEFRERLAFRPLPLTVLAPDDTLIDGAGPPLWRVRIAPGIIEPTSLRCYVPGQPPARIVAADPASGSYEIKAVAPLGGRRSKYTLTATDRYGNWYWYSQLWVQPKR